ncbi:Potassium/sodium hyperpolarization-activated cyclic nucleotide-gated channel 3 [Chytriomyces hyalinus]|nr:Potassium/sodium hyperpolarization-activated cyclic nucleotide-gated channel 3 [Chytriomyces hyalinus]
MQYGRDNFVACEYYGYAGSGKLAVPEFAAWLSTACSIIAIVVKLFEILWWYMAQSGLEYHSYRRARRSLRNPMRFAVDAAEMLAGGLQAGINEEDPCDVANSKAIEELGDSRIMYGEDLSTREMPLGHLRIGEYGKVKSIQKERQFGTVDDEEIAELDELLGNGRAAKFQGSGVKGAATRQEYAKAALRSLIKKVSFLRRNLGDGRDEQFEERVAAALKQRIFKKKEFIIEEGQIGNEMYFIAEGKVCVIVGGKPAATLTAGDYFGELALLGSVPRAASIQATMPVRLYCLCKGDFDGILSEFEDVRVRIDQIASDRAELLQRKKSEDAVN